MFRNFVIGLSIILLISELVMFPFAAVAGAIGAMIAVGFCVIITALVLAIAIFGKALKALVGFGFFALLIMIISFALFMSFVF
jgi:hypothetical protein